MLLPALALLAATPLLARADSPAPLSEKAQKALAGRTAGPSTACIQLSQIISTEIVDKTAVIYKRSSRLWYVNQPNDGDCTMLNRNRMLITHTTTPQLCGNDLVTIAESGSPALTYGACSLGRFVPYTK
jgi:hypothetical protein